MDVLAYEESKLTEMSGCERLGPKKEHTFLRPRLRKRDGIAIIVSNVLGVGIFTTPSIIAGLLPHPVAVIALWILGGFLALAGAISYAELAKLYPLAGGEYVYLSRIYGRAAGFLSGWTSLVAGFTGAVAASAVGAVMYLARYVPAIASDHVIWQASFAVGKITISAWTLTAAAIIAVFAALHSFSIRPAKLTQNSLALLITLIITAFVAAGFLFGHGSWANFHASTTPLRALRPVNWFLALVPVMFTYSGWNAATYVSEELHHTRRTIGPILFIGTLIIIVLYVLLNILYLYAVPLSQMQASLNIGDVSAHALFGRSRDFVSPVLIVALLGAISAMTIAGPRVYFSMARDRVFVSVFARTSRRFGTPAVAIWLQAAWAIMLVCCGQFEQILMYTGFAIVLSSGMAVAGLFWVRRQLLFQDSYFRLRMVLPAFFVLASTFIAISVFVQAPSTALMGITFIGAGIPVFYFTTHSSGPIENIRAEAAPGD